MPRRLAGAVLLAVSVSLSFSRTGADFVAMVSEIVLLLEESVSSNDSLLVYVDPATVLYPAVSFSDDIAFCSGRPAIVTRSPAHKGNGACFSREIETNLSCSCLNGFNETNDWVFRLKAPQAIPVDPPVELSGADALGVTGIFLMGLPAPVTSIKLEGESERPLGVEVLEPIGSLLSDGTPNPVLIRTLPTHGLDTVEVVNLDLGQVRLKEGFLPTRIRSLTMRNCNLAQLSTEFITSFDNLTSVDVSSNVLTDVCNDLTPAACHSGACALQTLNLSHNSISTFPSNLASLTNLKALDLSDNPFTNITVDCITFDAIAQLDSLRMNATNASDCGWDGNLQTLHGTAVCVLASETTVILETENTHSAMFYGLIGGGIAIVVVAIVVLAILFAGRKRIFVKKSETNDMPLTETLFYIDSDTTVETSVINDPIIITNRIPFKDIRVASCINAGGFGLVYSGVYNRKRVAIKKIRPEYADKIKFIESFLREVCLMATLSHPRIVEFIGVAWDSLHNLCAVTEYMERGDLRNVLHGFKQRGTRLTWVSHKITIAMHIAEGLTYLHSLDPKVIHRDLKSKNVLLDSDLHAKLSDFGISRERNFEETHMTAGIGTSFWIAPEVLLGKDYDERADIYSFGVVLSEIDTDDYPYWNDDNQNADVGNKAQEHMILQLVANGSMRPTFSESCPDEILSLADACLQLNPTDRPSAAEIVYRLQQMQQFVAPSAVSVASSLSMGFSTR